MAERRVLAHFMHEDEQGFANQQLTDPESTESFVMGTTDEAGIENLRARGLFVQVLDDEEIESAAASMSSNPRPLRAFVEPPPLEEGEAGYFLVKISGPLLEARREQILATGAEILEYRPVSSYVVRMTSDQAVQVEQLPFVTELSIYGPQLTGPFAFESAAAALSEPSAEHGTEMITWDLLVHRPEDADSVRQWLEERNVTLAGVSGRKIRFYLPQGSELVDEVPALPEVARMEPFVPPKLHNDIARGLMSVTSPPAAAAIGLTGKGQIVAVADTGLDDTHPDFKGRIAGVKALGRPGNSSDPNGHGTHVAGSVLGDGSASNGDYAGVAPEAKLFFQSLLDSKGGLGGLPLTLDALFEEAYKAGARIHNNSWGAATASAYTIDSSEVDEYIAKRRDMLIVISAGNEGVSQNPRNAKKGFVDWLSIGSPASCKNALTVGASRSSRTTGGLSSLKWKQAWPQDFPDPPIADELVSGDSEAMAAFSSRGPCDDRRIKPDLTAPGTDILSTRSATAPSASFWGEHASNRKYAYMGGTSMSAPLVAGCAALVREYLVAQRNHQPSAALLKAVLINGTRWLGGADAIADFAKAPNYHQGFGGVDLPSSIPNAARSKLKLEFVDNWKDPAQQFQRTGQRVRFRVNVGSGERLRICMAYTDLPARGLQNNLNLFVEHTPSKTKWMGNQDVPQSLNIPDPDNNVEVVRIDTPPPGDYLIQITATNLLQGPQDFALVVSGDLGSGITRAF